MKTQEIIEVDIDLDKPLICEANWVDRDDGTDVKCENPGAYICVGHDEINEPHHDEQIILCQDCVDLLTYGPAKCPDCDCLLVKSYRAL